MKKELEFEINNGLLNVGDDSIRLKSIKIIYMNFTSIF